eukprot:2217507-Amphidinium_carterae.1
MSRHCVPIPLTQLQARWASQVVMRYVADAPLCNLTGTYSYLHGAQLGREHLAGQHVHTHSSTSEAGPATRGWPHFEKKQQIWRPMRARVGSS